MLLLVGWGSHARRLARCAPCRAGAAGVDKVIFVGSTAVGKKVMAAASETLTPVVLELGGKDPFVVCEDVNLPEVCLCVGESRMSLWRRGLEDLLR